MIFLSFYDIGFEKLTTIYNHNLENKFKLFWHSKLLMKYEVFLSVRFICCLFLPRLILITSIVNVTLFNGLFIIYFYM
jgi:hypothetical protein